MLKLENFLGNWVIVVRKEKLLLLKQEIKATKSSKLKRDQTNLIVGRF